MKPETKKRKVKAPVIAIYLTATKDFQKQFYKDAEQLGLSASAFANVCLKQGYKTVSKKLLNKNTSRPAKKKAVAMK